MLLACVVSYTQEVCLIDFFFSFQEPRDSEPAEADRDDEGSSSQGGGKSL